MENAEQPLTPTSTGIEVQPVVALDQPIVIKKKRKKHSVVKRKKHVKKKIKQVKKKLKVKPKIKKPNKLILAFKRMKLVPRFKKLLHFLAQKGAVRNIYTVDFVLTVLLLNWWAIAISFSFSQQVKMASSIILIQILMLLGVITWMSTRKIK